jgi:hypothetical protein
MPSQVLQIIFEMQSQRVAKKKVIKKIRFVGFFFILISPTSSMHNFLVIFSN